MTERGSAMLLAMFVMILLTGMGISLLFLSQSEVSLGAADLGSKQAYYFAEAGVEVARLTLFNANGNGTFDDDLVTHAGGDGVIDFDPGAAKPVFDGQDQVTGFTGFDDILFFPGDNIAEFMNQLGTIERIVPDGLVCADSKIWGPDMKQRQIIGIDKERDAGFFCLVENFHGIRVKGVAQHFIEQIGRTDGEF